MMSIVKKIKAEIVAINSHGNKVYTLEFAIKQGRFKFIPGQFLHLTLDNYDPAHAWPQSRCFSMQSAPDENNLKITYIVKGAFTQQMEESLSVGKDIWLKMPFGDLFTQDHTKEGAVFIAGGTGITPYLSLFTSNAFAQYKNAHLYCGFRSIEHNLYTQELAKAKLINTSLKITTFYQDVEGIIDIKQILDENSNKSVSFFISGPPLMIKSFKSFLLANGILENQVKTDDWE